MNQNTQEQHSRSEYASGFRDAATAVRKANNRQISVLTNMAALALASLAIDDGYLTREQIEQVTAQSRQEAQYNLTAHEAGKDVENAFLPLARHFERLADIVEGKGASAPFTDISTEASKRAALANELRAVRDQLATSGEERHADASRLIAQQTDLEDKAVELGFISDAELQAIYRNAESMSRSNASFTAAASTIANRIEQGSLTQNVEKVA